jgi:predicted TIM-barrel fold metal-dependent hydrolase
MDLVKRLGSDNIMWSSDYPHSDSTWPHSRTFLQKVLKNCPEDITRKVVNQNAARLYHLG